jgi:hypothetical protein
MKWKDISPDLVTFVCEPISEAPLPDGLPMPEELTRNHEEWREYASRLRASGPGMSELPASPKLRFGRTRRLALAGIAAVLLFGCLSLLYTQRSLKQQLALEQVRERAAAKAAESAEADVAVLRREKEAMARALGNRSRMADELRKKLSDAKLLNRRLSEDVQHLSNRLGRARSEEWPPESFLLTGKISASPKSMRTDYFTIWLHHDHDSQFRGTAVPVSSDITSHVPVVATIVENQHDITIKFEPPAVPHGKITQRELMDLAKQFIGKVDPIWDDKPVPEFHITIADGGKSFSGNYLGRSISGRILHLSY